MNSLFLCSVALLLVGVYLQEVSHFVVSSYSESCYVKKTTRVFIGFGIVFEFLSLAQLPLCTYVVLGSLHVLVFKHVLIKDEKRSFTPAENLGSIAIISGCVIVSLFGPEQGEIDPANLKDLFDLYYYMYTVISLFITLFLRRLGFFSGRILIETGLVSQLNSFSICALKVLWIQLIASERIVGTYAMLCVLVVFVGNLMSNSFIRVFLVSHDLVIVMGGYFMWSLCYCLPLSLFFRTGVGFTWLNFSALVFSCCLIVPGVYLHSFTRIEYLKAYKEGKLNKVPDFIV